MFKITKKNIAVVAIGVLALVGCDKQSEQQASSDTLNVVIATANPLTGSFAHWGKDAANGVQLAVDEANKKNFEWDGKKVTFSFISEDDQGDAKTAAQVASRFVDSSVNVVVGHLSTGPTMVAGKTYHENNIPVIAYSVTGPDFTNQGYNDVFRVIPDDNQQGVALAGYAIKKLGMKNFAIVHDKTAYGQGLADAFKRAAQTVGGELVDTQYTTNSATEFSALVTKLKTSNPEIVFYGGMDAQAAPLVKEMRRQGLTAKFMGADGIQTETFLQLAGDVADGILSTTTGSAKEDMPGYTVFEAAYKQAFKQDIVSYAPYAYDAANVMISAMNEAQSSDPNKYLPLVKAIDYTGVTGKIQFNEKGDIKNGIVTLYEYKEQDGKWHIVK